MKQESHLIHNAIITPDGTKLVSNHRHDYQQHTDKKNGNKYAVDGGLTYQRITGLPGTYINASVFSDDSHERIRGVISWGTYGPNGDQPLKYKLLYELDTDHIEAILRTQNLPDFRVKIFKDELQYRIDNQIK